MNGHRMTSRRQVQTVGTRLQRLAHTLLVHAVTWSLAVPPSYLASTLVLTPVASAAAFTDGYGKFLKHNYGGAQASLKTALQARMAKAEQARTTQLLGMSQYMLGDTAGATKSFKAALAIDKSLSIPSSDKASPDLLAYYKGVKSGKGGSQPPAKAAKNSESPPAKTANTKGANQPASPAPASPKGPEAPRGKPSGPRTTDANGDALKQTFLTVTSTTKGASISIDGIIAGPVNSQINTDPGNVTIEVTMQGYISKKIRVLIAKDRPNNITVNLEKPKPKPLPPQPAAQPETNLASGAPQGGYAPTPAARTPVAGSRQAMNKKIKNMPPSGSGKPRAPSPSDDMFGEAQTKGPQGSPPPGPDLTAQFAADAAAALQPPQQYAQQQPFQPQPQQFQPQQFQPQQQQFQQQQFQQPQFLPQQYQQPQQYAPPPQYYTPPQQYYPQPQQYYPPPPPPAYYAPPPDPLFNDMQAPATAAPAATARPQSPSDLADPGFAGAPGAPARRGIAKSPKSDSKILAAFIPFGTGQFYNSRILLGLGFMAAEGAALSLFFYSMQQNAKTVKDANAYNAAYCNGQDNPPPECQTNYVLTSAKAKSLSQNSNYALMGFGLVHSIGVIQALLDDGKTVEPKKRGRTKNINFGDSYRYNASEAELAEAGEAPVDLQSFHWQIDPTLAYDQQQQRPRSALSLNLNWTF